MLKKNIATMVPLAKVVLLPDAIGILEYFSTRIWPGMDTVESTELFQLGLMINLPRTFLARQFADELHSYIGQVLPKTKTNGYVIDRNGRQHIVKEPTQPVPPWHLLVEDFAEPLIFLVAHTLLLTAIGTELKNPVVDIAEGSTIKPDFERNIIVLGFMVFFANVLTCAAQLLPLYATKNRTKYGILKPFGPATVNLIQDDQPVSGKKDTGAPAFQRLASGSPLVESAHGVLVIENPSDQNKEGIGTALAQPSQSENPNKPPFSAVIVNYHSNPDKNSSKSDDYLVSSGRFDKTTAKKPSAHEEQKWEVDTHSQTLTYHLKNIAPKDLTVNWEIDSKPNGDGIQDFLQDRPQMVQYDWLILYGAQALATLKTRGDEVTVKKEHVQDIRNYLLGNLHNEKLNVSRTSKEGRVSPTSDKKLNVLPTLDDISKLKSDNSQLMEEIVNILWETDNPTLLDQEANLGNALELVAKDDFSFATFVGHDNQIKEYVGLIQVNALLQVYWEQQLSRIQSHDEISNLWVPPHVSLLLTGGYSGGKSTVLKKLDALNTHLVQELRKDLGVQKPLSFITRTPLDKTEIRSYLPNLVPQHKVYDPNASFVMALAKNLRNPNPQWAPYVIKGAYVGLLFYLLGSITTKISEKNEDNSELLLGIMPWTFIALIAGMTIGVHYLRRSQQIEDGRDDSIVPLNDKKNRFDLFANTEKLDIHNEYKYNPNPQHRTQLPPNETVSGAQKTIMIEELDKLLQESKDYVDQQDVIHLLERHTRSIGTSKEKYRALVLCAANNEDSIDPAFNLEVLSKRDKFESEVVVKSNDVLSTRIRLLLLGYQAAKNAKIPTTPTYRQLKELVDRLLNFDVERATGKLKVDRKEIKKWIEEIKNPHP